MRTGVRWALGLAAGVLVAIQLLPWDHPKTNPPVRAEPEWDDPRTARLFERTCGDCHSHATDWPWYASVAPTSWLVTWDVHEARHHFDVSAPGGTDDHGPDAAGLVRDGTMPPCRYRLVHPEAWLSEAERARLASGLEATFGPPPSDPGGASHEHAGHASDPEESGDPHDHDHDHDHDPGHDGAPAPSPGVAP